MNTEEKPKSGSKLEFDSNYDLRLVSNLSPTLRWVLVLPIAFLAVFMIHLAYNFIVKLALSNFDKYGVISIIINSVFILIKYSIFVVTAVGTAPVKRERKFLVSIIFAVIASCMSVGINALLLSFSRIDSMGMVIATGIAPIIGSFLVVLYVRSDTKKPVEDKNFTAQQ